MESQFTARNLKINRNKSIGEVLIIVEGEVYEHKLLRHIFTKILDYNYVSINKNNIVKTKYQSKTNINSSVVVVNIRNSNISSVLDVDDYFDKLYNFMMREYARSLKYVRTYFIWDRDLESNKTITTKEVLKNFTSAWDNDNYEMNGLALLSYPCIEVFTLANFEKMLYKKYFKTSEETKNHLKSMGYKKYNINNITEETLLLAVENMNRVFKDLNISEYDTSNFGKINLKIFDEQMKYYDEDGFRALSLVSIILIDLGIVEVI